MHADAAVLKFNERGPSQRASHVLALLACVLTWPLLLVGGTVTVYKVGMAVPDFPTTFGVNMFLYSFRDSPWGVFLEHSHRLFGALLGLVVLTWAVLTLPRVWRASRGLCVVLGLGLLAAMVPTAVGGIGGVSPMLTGLGVLGVLGLLAAGWLAGLGQPAQLFGVWLALAAVVGQGILGGYRVRLNSAELAMVHGSTAQLAFAFLVGLWVITSRAWLDAPARQADTGKWRRRSLVLVVLLILQIALGVWTRHEGTGWAVLLHALFATSVWGHALALGLRARRLEPGSWLRWPAVGVLVATSLQMGLGGLTWWLLRPFDGIDRAVWPGQALLRITHQGIGALALALAVVLALRAARSLRVGVFETDEQKAVATAAERF